MKSSLTSITFRQKSLEEIVALAKKAELSAIEWGGDVHVAPGDQESAKKALALCRENGLDISGYGTYFYATDTEDFAPVLENALILETPIIRVWAGKGFGPSENYPSDARKKFTEKLANAAFMAKERGLTVATEFHSSSLTDNISSAMQLFSDAPDLKSYWQPRTHPKQTIEENLSDIATLGDKLINVHTFHWLDGGIRRPLSEASDEWLRYFRAVKEHGNAGYAAIEFVMDNTDEQLCADAETLNALLSQI